MRDRIPNIAALKATIQTAKLGSFSAAADQLGVTQGAVAQQIRQLEAQLGFQLFDRWARGLRPTSACTDFIQEVEPALQRIENATHQLASSHDNAQNHVLISTTPSIASRWLIPRLAAFYLAHSNIVLAIDATEKLRRFVGPNAIDIAIRWGDVKGADLNCQTILTNDLIAVCGPALLGRQMPNLSHLHAMQLVDDAHYFWKQWATTFDVILPTKPVNYGQTNNAIDAAINGLGIVLAPSLLVKNALDDKLLVRALPEQFDLHSAANFNLITRVNERQEAVTIVTNWLKDIA